MTEALLHYIWQTRQYDARKLLTARGEPVFIIHPGYLNRDAGPDFQHARIRIGSTLWAGHIELHIRSSDWKLHRHSEDPAYQNVILHVVYQHDTEIYLPGKEQPLPTLELKPRISGSLIQIYQQFYNQQREFACEKLFSEVEGPLVALSMQRMAVERLEDKALRVRQLWISLERDWFHTLLCLVARTLAGPVNGDSMQQLMTNISPIWLLRSRDDLVQLEALLLGTGGLLAEPCDEYGSKLAKEFAFWQQKHTIRTMDPVNWKYSRMRPDNFVDLRLAQLASWIHYNESIWSKLLTCPSWKGLRELFRIQLRHYWTDHYRLGKPGSPRVKSIGEGTLQLLLVNALAPLIFLYGKEHDEPVFQERAMIWLSEVKPENNKIVRSWEDLGVVPENGFEAQGLIHWKKTYCEQKACANCPVGHSIFRKYAAIETVRQKKTDRLPGT